MQGENECFCYCPYCGEPISFLIESYYGEQSYIEDCQVCCRPIEIDVKCVEGQVRELRPRRLDD